MDAPAWLNNEYFHEIVLRDGEDEPIEVLKVVFVNGSLRGESFLSSPTHIAVQYKHSNDLNSVVLERFFFVKLYDLENVTVNKVREMGLYDREHELYEKVFPNVKQLLGSSSNLIPDFFKSEEKCLILSDLSKLGYCTMKRQLQLDLKHSLAVLRSLAKFHASTAVIMNECPGSLDKYKPLYIVRGNENMFKVHYGSSFHSAARAVGMWPGYEKYEAKLHAFYEKLFERLIQLGDTERDHFCVLIHGDLWVNNILFKHEETTGEILDVTLIDFQHSAIGRPSRDLHYFIFSSVQEPIREEYLDLMLEEYHRTLTSTLGALGCSNEFSFDDLMKDFDNTLLLGLTSATVVLTAVLQDADEATDYLETLDEEMISSGALLTLSTPYSCERFRQQYQKLLCYFNNKGLL